MLDAVYELLKRFFNWLFSERSVQDVNLASAMYERITMSVTRELGI